MQRSLYEFSAMNIRHSTILIGRDLTMGVTSVVRLVAVHDVFEAFAVIEDALEQTV